MHVLSKLDHVREEIRETFPQASWVRGRSIAVLLPCYNEAAAVGDVVHAFRRALPSAEIYVYDNNSTDGTSAAAGKAGAIVRTEPYQGKGNVVRRMLRTSLSSGCANANASRCRDRHPKSNLVI